MFVLGCRVEVGLGLSYSREELAISVRSCRCPSCYTIALALFSL